MAAAIALALTGAPAGAATLTVTNSCSLVDAITAANTNTAVGGCPAGDDQDDGRDIIELSGNVLLTDVDNSSEEEGENGLPLIESAITINGNGYTIERSLSAPTFRLIKVAPEGRLEVNDVTLTRGSVGSGGPMHRGGALLNRGEATLNRCQVMNNSANIAGGISNTGTLTLNETELSGNGVGDGDTGALGNAGQVTLNKSIIRNSISPEVTIFNGLGGEMTFIDSLITDNRSWFNSGKVLLNGGTLTLINSTISGDDRGITTGSNGTTTLIHSTIAHNGRAVDWGSTIDDSPRDHCCGLVVNGEVRLVNSIVANNDSFGSDCFLRGGSVTFEGLSLIGDGSCDADGHGQLTGDPHLEPLADNGGPTLTHALLPSSPAIDRIAFIPSEGCEPTEVTTDQRGIRRPQGNGCDIGAYERIQPLNLEAILEFFDQAVAEGTVVGQGPGRSASHRLKAFRNQLQRLNAHPQRGSGHPACRQLATVINHADPNSPNAFISGPAVPELMFMLKSWGNELSCPESAGG